MAGTKIGKEALAVLCPLAGKAEAPYLCVVRYEDGTGSLERFERAEEATELRERAASGLSALLSVDIFVRLP